MSRSDEQSSLFEEPSGGTTRGGGRDRDLILDAIRQADEVTVAMTPPASGSVASDLPINIFPGYILKGEIHRGGQGVVYKAEQPSTGRTVAIKLMHGGATAGDTGRARFELEVQVLGRLEHPGIVRVHDSGVTEDGSVYYVMDYIAGQPLDAIIREWRREAERVRGEAGVDPDSPSGSRTTVIGSPVMRERLEMFVKICEGVSAAHVAGVIHRDLKPANIRLNRHGEPVVVDFGLAKMLGGASGQAHAMTTTGQFVGSMPWSSPEQAEGANRVVDTRSDVYSLGIILYQMVTGGKFPYKVVGTARQVMNTIVTAEPRRPSFYDRGINDEVETIILKAIAKEPERRYQGAGELARDIRRYLDGDAIEAKRDSTWYVMTKALRRHRLSAGFVAAIVLMGTAFSVALAAKYTEAEAARIDATSEAAAANLARDQADAARERAQANFLAVQDLSRAFLFDFHDEIRNLRGAGAARALLVERATQYLDRLRTQADAEADPDPSLLLDLAAAYDRLASVQAGFAESNRGESEAAGASVAEAARIRDLLVERIPDDPALWLGIASGAEQRARLEQAQGQFEEAIATALRGAEAAVRAGELGASDATVAGARAPLLAVLGDLEHRLGRAADDRDGAIAHLDAAMGWYDAARVAHDEAGGSPLADADLVLHRARSTIEKGRWHQHTADGNDAAVAEAERVARDGLAMAQEAVGAFGALRADDASAREALRGMITALMEESFAWETLGRIVSVRGADAEIRAIDDRAFETAQAALTYAQALAGDETDLDAQRLLGIAMNKVGNALRSMDRLDEAELLYDEMIAQRQGVVATDRTPRHMRDLAIAFVKRAQIDQIRARSAEGSAALELLEAAEAGYARALGVFEELAAMGVPMDRELGEVTRVLDTVRNRIAAPAE